MKQQSPGFCPISSPKFGSYAFLVFTSSWTHAPSWTLDSWHFSSVLHFHLWFSEFYSQSCLGCPCGILLHIFCHYLDAAWDTDWKSLFSDLLLKWLNVILWCEASPVSTRKYSGIMNLRNLERSSNPNYLNQ